MGVVAAGAVVVSGFGSVPGFTGFFGAGSSGFGVGFGFVPTRISR